MNIKKELKLNRFRLVRIPKKGELYRQFGELQGNATYSGDEIAEGIGRKSDTFAASEELMRQLDEKRRKEQDDKGKK